jgi:RNA polymerase sigma factor (sigma-70 family)
MTLEERNSRLAAWLAEHAAILHHVANGFAEGADRQDLFQELSLALWRAIPAFRGDARVSTFIYRVAHNCALTWRRTQKNYRSRIDRYEVLDAPGAGADPVADRERETLAHVYAAIRRLPPLDRSLLLLHLDGVSYAEIAALHGFSESNVGARLTRLRQKLTTDLEEISHELR